MRGYFFFSFLNFLFKLYDTVSGTGTPQCSKQQFGFAYYN